jgi:hypothetical protein
VSRRDRYCAIGDLQRDIMRCRRREETASVLVARLSRDARLGPGEIVACFRLTDSVAASRRGGSIELVAVFDDHGLEREGLERRLLAAARGARVELEWLRFPDDGVTLETLVARGRAALSARNGRRPALRLGAVPLSTASGKR